MYQSQCVQYSRSTVCPSLCSSMGMVFPKELDFGFMQLQQFSSGLLWIIKMFTVKVQTGLYMFLITGTLWVFQSVIALWITRYVFVNCGSSFLQVIDKLLAHGLVAQSSLVPVYNLIHEVLWCFPRWWRCRNERHWFCGILLCVLNAQNKLRTEGSNSFGCILALLQGLKYSSDLMTCK